MEYQKVINLLDNGPNQPSKFKIKNWVEINDGPRGTYNEDNQIKFKSSMLKSSFCDYSNAYILIKGTLTVANTAIKSQPNNAINKKVTFKNCRSFTNCMSRINNMQVNHAHYIDVVMPIYNLTEYSNNYSKISWTLWQYFKDELTLDADNAITAFNADNATTDLFKIKEKVTGKTGDNGRTDVKIMVPLKYLSNFWRTLEMLSINCEINLDLNWSKNCLLVASNADQGTRFSHKWYKTLCYNCNFINSR